MAFNQTHHMQTPEGKRAATEARRRWAAERPPAGAPRLFIVRLKTGQHLRYGWEIRKFGSFVLSKSDKGFETQSEAQIAGEKDLAMMVST